MGRSASTLPSNVVAAGSPPRAMTPRRRPLSASGSIVERPILFSGAMVRAILDGSKTQTRRIMPTPPSTLRSTVPGYYVDSYCSERKTEANPRGMGPHWCWWAPDGRQGPDWIRCKYGVPGDRLWVRETWRMRAWDENGDGSVEYRTDGARRNVTVLTEHYDDWLEKHCARLTKAGWLSDADGVMYHPKGIAPPWRPSIYCERWASRITLAIESIRVERLQSITEADAIAEGVESLGRVTEPRGAYAALWNSINEDRAPWTANPWVWVIGFSVVRGER